MAKLSLTDISSGYGLTTTINANNALLEAALENTLSRDGTAPNTMSAALDMNSQRITNLPTAVSNSEPVTLGQAATIAGVTNPLTRETVGAVFYPETSAETNAGVTPTNYYYEPGDVRRYGAVLDGVTDCSSAFQDALNGTGKAIVPTGTAIIDTVSITGASTYEVIMQRDSILKHKDSATDSMFDFTSTSSKIRFTGGKIDGNKANVTTKHLIEGLCDEAVFLDIEFVDMSKSGIFLQSTTAHLLHVERCSFIDGTDSATSANACIYIDAFKRDITKIIDCEFRQDATNGTSRYRHPSAIELSGNCAGDVFIHNCYFYNLGNDDGSSPIECVKIYTHARKLSIKDNTFIDPTGQAIVFHCCTNVEITGNTIEQNNDLNGIPSGSPTLIYGDNNDRSIAINSSFGDAGEWNISNNKLTNASGAKGGAIQVVGSVATGPQVNNVYIHDNVLNCEDTNGSQYGIYAGISIKNISIKGNVITGAWDTSIYVAGSRFTGVTTNIPVNISGNVITDSDNRAIRVTPSTSAVVTLRVSENIISDCGTYPIHIDDVDRALVSNNVLENVYSSGTPSPATKENGWYRNMTYLVVQGNMGFTQTTLYDLTGVTNYRIYSNEKVIDLSNDTGDLSTYSITNVSTDRACDADTVAVAELADIVGTLIVDLKARGFVD